jgi:LPS export ABC transporter protein LptC
MRRLYLALPAALLLAALYFAWQGLQGPQSAARAPAEEPPRYAVTGAQWVRLGRQGAPEFRAEAAAIDYYADDSAKLRDIRLDALGGYASPWHIVAPAGEAPPRERRLLLTGEVRAVGEYEDGVPVSFETTRLWVDLLRRELHTDAPVTVQAGDRSAAARGLRADFAGERVQLLNDVRVDYVPES